jgi:hypothetical protein
VREIVISLRHRARFHRSCKRSNVSATDLGTWIQSEDSHSGCVRRCRSIARVFNCAQFGNQQNLRAQILRHSQCVRTRHGRCSCWEWRTSDWVIEAVWNNWRNSKTVYSPLKAERRVTCWIRVYCRADLPLSLLGIAVHRHWYNSNGWTSLRRWFRCKLCETLQNPTLAGIRIQFRWKRDFDRHSASQISWQESNYTPYKNWKCRT